MALPVSGIINLSDLVAEFDPNNAPRAADLSEFYLGGLLVHPTFVQTGLGGTQSVLTNASVLGIPSAGAIDLGMFYGADSSITGFTLVTSLVTSVATTLLYTSTMTSADVYTYIATEDITITTYYTDPGPGTDIYTLGVTITQSVTITQIGVTYVLAGSTSFFTSWNYGSTLVTSVNTVVNTIWDY